MEIYNRDYHLRPLKLEDGYLMRGWGEFEDPLLCGYNYNDLSDSEIKRWYFTKQKIYRASYYAAIDKNGDMIGFLGVKEINKFVKRAKLGIVLDPNKVSKGYGKKLLKDFLKFYFLDMKMRKLVLAVNDWNYRAKRLYEGLGFKYEFEKYEYFENQDIDLKDPKYSRERESFEERGASIYSKIHIMSLTRQEYLDEVGDRKK